MLYPYTAYMIRSDAPGFVRRASRFIEAVVFLAVAIAIACRGLLSRVPRWMRFSAFAFALAACSLLPTSTQTDISNFLAGLSNKATTDLQTALATANTPAANLPGGVVDQAGSICLNGSASPESIGGLIGAQKEVNAVLKNANVAGAGGVTAVEVATLIQPGSPQMTALATGVAADCGPKIAQVSSAIAGTQAWFAALAGQFAIQLAPAGL